MNAITKIATPAATSAARKEALTLIAPLAYMEGTAKGVAVIQVRKVLGNKPTAIMLASAGAEYRVGRIAAKIIMPPEATEADCIKRARDVLKNKPPVKDGVMPKALAKGEYRRTPEQHKAVRAADQAWSTILAELGLNKAKTQAETDKKKRGTKAAKAKAASAAASEAVTKTKKHDKASACEYLANMATTMEQFIANNASLIPMDHGKAVKAFATAMLKAEALRKSVTA